jgi:hypothetical protein
MGDHWSIAAAHCRCGSQHKPPKRCSVEVISYIVIQGYGAGRSGQAYGYHVAGSVGERACHPAGQSQGSGQPARAQSPALSPTHTRRRGKLYTYYVSQAVLKGTDDGCTVRRISAGEIEAAVMDQVRELLRQPEVVIGTWRAAQAEAPDLTEAETREALEQLDPLWEELFPAEQERIVRNLVERVDVSPAGADIRLRLDGLAGLVRDLRASPVREAA